MEQTDTKVKYVLYARKSTESDEKQALSIDSQINEMRSIAQRDGLEVVDIRRESFSSKTVGQRPVFNQMLEDLKIGKFNAILTWAPDRLSRNAGDLGAIVDLLDKNVLIEVRTYGQTFTNTPNEKFLLMILGSQAKLENDQKGVNVRRGLRARCEQGLWPAPAPTGYLKHKDRTKKCHSVIDPHRAPFIKEIFEKFVYEDMSGREIQYWLRDTVNFCTKNGKPLSNSNVYKVLSTPFYYGEFEFPRGSGTWYQGVHKPIISKDLYTKAQQKLAGNRTKQNVKQHKFPFTRLMKCGLCGSGITAQEKYKKQKNGNEHYYVYYSCTRGKDRFCKNKYIREKEVVKQLSNIIDDIDLDEVNLGIKLEDELKRFSHFQSQILGLSEEKREKKHEVDIKSYAKYILREGNVVEQREILRNLKSKLVLKDKKIQLFV